MKKLTPVEIDEDEIILESEVTIGLYTRPTQKWFNFMRELKGPRDIEIIILIDQNIKSH